MFRCCFGGDVKPVVRGGTADDGAATGVETETETETETRPAVAADGGGSAVAKAKSRGGFRMGAHAALATSGSGAAAATAATAGGLRGFTAQTSENYDSDNFEEDEQVSMENYDSDDFEDDETPVKYARPKVAPGPKSVTFAPKDGLSLAEVEAMVRARKRAAEAAKAAAASAREARSRLDEGYTVHRGGLVLRPSRLMEKVKEFWEEVKASPAAATTPARRTLLVGARQASADEYLALPQEMQDAMQFQEKKHASDSYSDPYYASLNAALADGSTALVRADFLERLAAEGRPLGHRAELPPEAFYEGPIWSEQEERGTSRGVLIVALSYMWATADHPDPDGEQVRDVAKYLHWLQKSESRHKGKMVAVFWDWASLYQDKPSPSNTRRTDEQTALYKSGLQNANLWYCHPNTLTLMNRKKPPGRRWGYNQGGWPVR
jgi:hypothetical protein